MEKVIISIIMPTFNNAQYLDQAILSVQAQTEKQWELIIINDASTDESKSILESYAKQDPRIKLVHHTVQKKLAISLNEGLGLVAGEYVARLDGDDYWVDADKLLKQKTFLDENPDYALIGTNAEAVDGNNQYLFSLLFPQEDEDIRKSILQTNCFLHSSVMFRMSVAKDIGGYLNTEGFVEDYELWLIMGMKHKFHVLPEIGVNYRINTKGITQTNGFAPWQAFMNLSHRYRSYYPGYTKAFLKLNFQKIIIRLFGPASMHKIKFFFLRKK